MLSLRLVAGYAIVSFFILFFFVSSLTEQARDAFIAIKSDSIPDFSLYREFQTLSDVQFPIDNVDQRVIIIGDVHGKDTAFHSLLSKLSYDSSKDVLISTGDIIAKGPLNGSLAVLSWMASHNITAVRGNHDQKVIEWRSWINWIHSIPAGKRWLRNLNSRFLEYVRSHPAEDIDIKAWVKMERNKDRRRDNSNVKWWNRIPEGWKLFQDHYLIAENMSEAEYQYLLERPLILHIPHAHAYIAHAGVLASNPKLDPFDEQQPLARVPQTSAVFKSKKDKKDFLRKLQEVAVLHKVPQNKDPWVTLNMRGVLENDQVTRGKDGRPWSKLYNKDMSLCKGFDDLYLRRSKSGQTLPCHPVTAIYGHAASRGLDIKRWTIGLDSGCVYEQRLSSLVLGGKYARSSFSEDDSDVDEDPEFGAYDINGNKLRSTIPFGDSSKGKIVSVPCH